MTTRAHAYSHRVTSASNGRQTAALAWYLANGIGLADAQAIFIRNLKFWLKERGIKASAFAVGIGKSQSTISHWFAGDSAPDMKTLGEIAKTLEIPVSSLFASEDDRPAPGQPAPKVDDAERALKVLAARAGFEISVRPKRQN